MKGFKLQSLFPYKGPFRLKGFAKPELATKNDGRNFVDLLPMESIHAIRVMLPRNTEGRAQA